jgi:hypothetical protein
LDRLDHRDTQVGYVWNDSPVQSVNKLRTKELLVDATSPARRRSIFRLFRNLYERLLQVAFRPHHLLVIGQRQLAAIRDLGTRLAMANTQPNSMVRAIAMPGSWGAQRFRPQY